MQRLEVVLSEAAISDLEDLQDYIIDQGASVETALDFTGRIKARCGRVGHAPNAGRERSDLSAGLRTVPFERRTLIAYRIERRQVKIVAIFYGGRDYEALLRGDSSES